MIDHLDNSSAIRIANYRLEEEEDDDDGDDDRNDGDDDDDGDE